MSTETWQIVGTDIKVIGADAYRAQMRLLQSASDDLAKSMRALQITAGGMRFDKMLGAGGGGAAQSMRALMGGGGGGGAAVQSAVPNAAANIGASARSAFGMASSAASGFRGVLGTLMSPIGLITGGLAALGGALTVGKINQVSNEFEQMRIKMAQTMLFMDQASTFTDAMGVAEGMINRINVDAARLPGEASDYAAAMATAGAAVQRATGDMEKSYDLVRDTTAVLVSMGADGSYAGRLITMALNTTRGQLEMGSDQAMNMVRAMQKIPGYANLTNQAFNKMSLAERTMLVTKMNEQFRGMIDAQEGTWEATKGAFDSALSTAMRIAGAPIFEGMKKAMDFVSSSLVNARGELTEFAKTFQIAGEVFKTAIGSAMDFAAERLAPFRDVIAALSSGEVVGGPMGDIIGDLQEIFLSIADFGYPVVDFLTALFDVGWNLVGSVLPGLIEGLSLVIDPLFAFAEVILTAASYIIEYLEDPIVWIGTAIGDLATSIGEVLGPIIDLVSGILGMFGSTLGDFVMPVLKGLGYVIGLVIEGLAKLLSTIGMGLRTLVGEGARTQGETARATGEQNWFQRTVGSIRDRLAERNAAGNAAAVARGPGDRAAGRGQGATVNQDFRNSKFNITNKFAEGFDPDRIAVAFAQDVGRAATRRGSSGLTPLYGVR